MSGFSKKTAFIGEKNILFVFGAIIIKWCESDGSLFSAPKEVFDIILFCFFHRAFIIDWRYKT